MQTSVPEKMALSSSIPSVLILFLSWNYSKKKYIKKLNSMKKKLTLKKNWFGSTFGSTLSPRQLPARWNFCKKNLPAIKTLLVTPIFGDSVVGRSLTFPADITLLYEQNWKLQTINPKLHPQWCQTIMRNVAS